MNLVVFSNNPKKLNEIQQIFSELNLKVLSYRDYFNREIDVVEDGKTFQENAQKKVLALPEDSSAIFLADDSGLEVDALDGKPGIHSARYGGEGLTDLQRCEVLLKELQPSLNREAQFRSVIAIKFPDSIVEFSEGIIRGKIANELKGDDGFGYDPLFIPSYSQQTFAQMGSIEKNKRSHRAIALSTAKDKIHEFLLKKA